MKTGGQTLPLFKPPLEMGRVARLVAIVLVASALIFEADASRKKNKRRGPGRRKFPLLRSWRPGPARRSPRGADPAP